MPVPDLIDLMGLYARQGIAHWQSAPAELRKRANECLPNVIADNDAEAAITINTIYNPMNAARLKFIPMPKVRQRGIERCFFLPVRQKTVDGEDTAIFELFLLVARKDCLAFRFEPADPSPSTHGYGHIQMCRKMLRKSIEPSGIPSWLPDSYPAFPISSSDPLRIFLSMATAVHGYESGVTRVLQDIFQNRPGDAALYLDILKKMLN